MKGVVFTEFLELVEEKYSLEVADRIIEASELASDGAYTTVGTYDYHEMIQLVSHLSKETGSTETDLLRGFGQHLFGRFYVNYPQFFKGKETAFEFLKNIDGYIHVEVRKLYADAELPSFEYEELSSTSLAMIYCSRRPFAALAEGLILGCAEHFGETIAITSQVEAVPELDAAAGTQCVRFVLSKQG